VPPVTSPFKPRPHQLVKRPTAPTEKRKKKKEKDASGGRQIPASGIITLVTCFQSDPYLLADMR